MRNSGTRGLQYWQRQYHDLDPTAFTNLSYIKQLILFRPRTFTVDYIDVDFLMSPCFLTRRLYLVYKITIETLLSHEAHKHYWCPQTLTIYFLCQYESELARTYSFERRYDALANTQSPQSSVVTDFTIVHLLTQQLHLWHGFSFSRPCRATFSPYCISFRLWRSTCTGLQSNRQEQCRAGRTATIYKYAPDSLI